MTQIYVVPAPGFKMRDEVTMQQIPAGGYLANVTSLVIRRMMTRVGGTDDSPIFELNERAPVAVQAPEPAPVARKSDRAEKEG